MLGTVALCLSAALASTAAEASATRPSILFLMPDQWRFDWDSFGRAHEEAVDLELPNLRRLAAEGTRFEHAYVQAVVCAPSRSCMASMRDYDDAGTATNGANDYDVTIPTYFSLLRAGGYHTMTTGKDDLTKLSQLGYHLNHSTSNASDTYHMRELGFSDGIRYSGKLDVISSYPEPHEAYGYMLNATTVALANGSTVNAFAAHAACLRGDAATCADAAAFPAGLYEDDWTARNAVALLDRAPADAPFFLWVSFPGPHNPFAVPEAYRVDRGDYPDAVDEPGPPRPHCDASKGPGLNRTRCDYAAELERLDEHFGAVVAAAERNAPGELVVCLFSDHGEMLDDHGGTDKSKPWQGAVSVPLVCSGGAVARNRTIAAPAAIIDLGATALDWAGVAAPPGATAASMRGLLEGAPEAARNRTVVHSGLRSSSFPESDRRLDEVETDAFDFRLAVARFAEGTFKFVCCAGACPYAPSTVSPPDADGYTRLLFDTVADPYDMRDVKAAFPAVAEALRRTLPVRHGFDCAAVTS